jgi:hypothetical protein
MHDVNLVGRARAQKMTLLAPFVSVEVPENCFLGNKSYRLWNAQRPYLCLNKSVKAFKSIIKKIVVCYLLMKFFSS